MSSYVSSLNALVSLYYSGAACMLIFYISIIRYGMEFPCYGIIFLCYAIRYLKKDMIWYAIVLYDMVCYAMRFE